MLSQCRKRKLFGTWQKTSQTGSSGATLLLHNTLRAFKFPDESQVYLKCDIEVSKISIHPTSSDSSTLFTFFCRFVVEIALKPFVIRIFLESKTAI